MTQHTPDTDPVIRAMTHCAGDDPETHTTAKADPNRSLMPYKVTLIWGGHEPDQYDPGTYSVNGLVRRDWRREIYGGMLPVDNTQDLEGILIALTEHGVLTQDEATLARELRLERLLPIDSQHTLAEVLRAWGCKVSECTGKAKTGRRT